MFEALRATYTMEHRLHTVKINSVYAECNMANHKPEVEITFEVSLTI